jgi:hypothetical protein
MILSYANPTAESSMLDPRCNRSDTDVWLKKGSRKAQADGLKRNGKFL